MKLKVALALAVLAGAPEAIAATDTNPVPAPSIKAGDSWTLNETVQQGSSGFSRRQFSQTVARVNSDSMLIATQLVDAPTAPQNRVVGLDWSARLVVDGEEKSAGRPLSFPMRVGDSWSADWTDGRRVGNQLKVHGHSTYKVVGWEDVTVPAGTFRALKIEAKGFLDADVIIPSVAQSTAVAGGGSGTSVSQAQAGGRGVVHRTTYDLVYYVPEVKRMVKTVVEQYNEGDVMTGRTTDELVSFKPGG